MPGVLTLHRFDNTKQAPRLCVCLLACLPGCLCVCAGLDPGMYMRARHEPAMIHTHVVTRCGVSLQPLCSVQCIECGCGLQDRAEHHNGQPGQRAVGSLQASCRAGPVCDRTHLPAVSLLRSVLIMPNVLSACKHRHARLGCVEVEQCWHLPWVLLQLSQA